MEEERISISISKKKKKKWSYSLVYERGRRSLTEDGDTTFLGIQFSTGIIEMRTTPTTLVYTFLVLQVKNPSMRKPANFIHFRPINYVLYVANCTWIDRFKKRQKLTGCISSLGLGNFWPEENHATPHQISAYYYRPSKK